MSLNPYERGESKVQVIERGDDIKIQVTSVSSIDYTDWKRHTDRELNYWPWTIRELFKKDLIDYFNETYI